MDCEDGYEEECEDDDMAGADYAFDHAHMEVRLSWAVTVPVLGS